MCRKPTEASRVDELAPDEAWLRKFDYEGFTAEVKALGKKLESEQGEDDMKHLNKMILWSNTFAAVGLLSMGFSVNIVTIFCLSVYNFTRWAMIAHHTCHGGYERIHPNLSRWSRFKFALGSTWRRWNDWFDWFMPEAWNIEHNGRHHYYLNEVTDPDMVENNASTLREMPLPTILKYPVLFVIMSTWKWFYYAPNTYKELKIAQFRREGRKLPEGCVAEDAVTFRSLIMSGTPFYSLFEFITVVVGPYFLIHFFMTPMPLYFLGEHLDGYSGKEMYLTAVTNLFLADILSNLHGFLCVVTNHAGDDMYCFRNSCRPFSGSFFLRQVLGSANYSMGTDLIDFMHGYLNYQVEHHLWPNLSMRSYQKAAPQVQAICKKYNVPYVKHNVFWRLKKTADIFIGTASMKRFPKRYEAEFLESDALMAERKTQ